MSLVGFKAQNHPQQTAKPEVDDRATTPEMFAPLHERFRFTIDVAASAENAKLPRFYSVEDNGLKMPWDGERVWCNPPYSNIEPWVIRAWDLWNYHPTAECIVMLLPANRTEQRWWQWYVEPYLRTPRNGFRVEFLPGRIRFIRRGSESVGPNERPPFGCCLLIWDRT